LQTVTSPAKSAVNTVATQLATNAPVVSQAIGTGVNTAISEGQQIDAATSALDDVYANQPLLAAVDTTVNAVTSTPGEAGYFTRPHTQEGGTAPCDTGWAPELDSNGNYEYFVAGYKSPRYEYGSNVYTTYWHHYSTQGGHVVFRWSHCKYLRANSFLILIRDEVCTGNGQGCTYDGSKWTPDNESGKHWKETVGHCVGFYEDTDHSYYAHTPSFCG